MEPKKARSEASDALRTEQIQAAAEELQQDAVDRKHARQQLSDVNATLQLEILARTRAESEFNRMFEATPDMMALSGFDGYYKRVNPAMLATLGYTETEMLGLSLHELIHPGDLATIGVQFALLASGGETRNVYYRVKHKSGRYLTTEWTDVPLVEGGLFLTMGRDITARVELEDSLRNALASMRYAQRIGMVGSWEVDVATGVSEWSEETYRICGMEPGNGIPSVDDFYALVHPADKARVRAESDSPLAQGEQRRLDYRIVLKNGRERNLVAHMEMVFAADGTPLRLRGTCQDTTDHRAAIVLRTRLEEQVRLAQKMEAVGSLAGGVAHDFNNLMSVILTYVGFVTDSLPEGDTRRDDLAEVQKADDRAAVLTRQLLALGRKQVLEPVPLNMNQVAVGLEGMLRRIIGEDIALEHNLDPALGLAMADPGQIEQIVMNLVSNACDAMPNGGSLTIETNNVEFDVDQVAGLTGGS